MRLVIDTNIVFSALIAGGKTRECIITAPVELYAPEFFYSEFENHRKTILSKTNLDDDQLTTLFALLFENIELVPRSEFADHIRKAREIMESIDPDDVPFLALALSQECDIWSDDDHFQEQSAVKAWESHDLFPIWIWSNRGYLWPYSRGSHAFVYKGGSPGDCPTHAT